MLYYALLSHKLVIIVISRPY